MPAASEGHRLAGMIAAVDSGVTPLIAKGISRG